MREKSIEKGPVKQSKKWKGIFWKFTFKDMQLINWKLSIIWNLSFIIGQQDADYLITGFKKKDANPYRNKGLKCELI